MEGLKWFTLYVPSYYFHKAIYNRFDKQNYITHSSIKQHVGAKALLKSDLVYFYFIFTKYI